MLGLILIILLAILVIVYRDREPSKIDIPRVVSDKLDKLWLTAQQAAQDKKYLRAEKALLTILRVDERNASAYNRLGIIYAKQGDYKDAIECFEIAQSLEPSASSLHNVGLIYFETENYVKAALAFEQALAIEEDVATRHIAYAKVQEKLGHNKKMIEALERAVELDRIPQSLRILADAYDKVGETELATNLRNDAAKMIIPAGQPKRLRQPRKVVM